MDVLRQKNQSRRSSSGPRLVTSTNAVDRVGDDDQDAGMNDHDPVLLHYSEANEKERLTSRAVGVLERLRTWDIFERFLPPSGVVYDIGGGAGVHAVWLAGHGFEVQLFEPVSLHIDQATAAAEQLDAGQRFSIELADARSIPREDLSADVVLLLGPLYHLLDRPEREECLEEAHRLLKPGGLLVAAGISRFSWLMDAYRQSMAQVGEVQTSISFSVETGRSTKDPEPTSFQAYLHRPEELEAEIVDAGFVGSRMVGVEGFAWMLNDLDRILGSTSESEALLNQLRSVESEPSMLGASSHYLTLASKPT